MHDCKFNRYAVALIAAKLDKDHNPKWETESRKLFGYSDSFRTVYTYPTVEEAQREAASFMAAQLTNLMVYGGYKLVCSPKTIDVDNHDWRRIARVKSPDGKLISVIAYTPVIDGSFAPWMY